jgi:endoglucanase
MKTKRGSTVFFIPVLIMSLTMIQCSKKIESKKLEMIDSEGLFLVNQVGYLPKASKVALIRANTDKFYLVNAFNGNIVFTGTVSKPKYWKYSGDSVSTADFSTFKKTGTYRLCLAGNTPCSFPFSINDSVYHHLAQATIKAFYYNRASLEIKPEYGGKWARKAGHPDTAVFIHPSAASSLRSTGSILSSPRGWYDAGDYNKYVVNSGITTYTLLLFYQMFPVYCKSLETNIPESTNDIPDVVDELLWNLNWMLSMQDPNDGGVYHKLTNKNFDAFVVPDLAKTPRYVVQKTTAATLDFAATMAMASRVFSNDKNIHLKNLSPVYLAAAMKAMKWAKQNPAICYVQPQDITTGGYGDSKLNDELFWATIELSLATGDKTLLTLSCINNQELNTPSWNQVEALGMISMALSDNKQFRDLKMQATKQLLSFTNDLLHKYEPSPYKISLDFFKWGSNSDVVNQAMLKLVAYRITHKIEYLPSVVADLDYILGKNPTTYCFVTGFGTHSPINIHHRPSGSDTIAEPVPGFMPGGPNTVVMNDCKDSTLMKQRSLFPAKSYSDVQCSYSTNEIAINWNAPLFFVVGALDAWGLKK